MNTPLLAARVVRLQGIGMWAPGGLYSAYDTKYQSEMENWLSENDFHKLINAINTSIVMRWPCVPCYCFSTVCCPFTLGLSTLLVRCLCFSDAEMAAQATIQRVNDSQACRESGVTFKLVYSRCRSWIEVSRESRR
uniref:Uncharacterized protein n=1 Tax=Lotharella oceanica TaxID=641309 RepID=A0A7S2XEB9_9EUKA